MALTKATLIDLNSNEQWGWIADIIMNEESFKIPHNDKIILIFH